MDTIQKRVVSKVPGYAWVILLIVFAAGFTAPANMAKVITLAPVIAQTFGLDEAGIGMSIAMFYLLGCIFAFPTALIISKLGLKRVITIALALGVLGSLLGLITEDLVIFLISRFLEGAGLGIMGVAGTSAITPWFPANRRALPLGIWAMWVALAMFLCPNIYAAIQTTTGAWQSSWWATFGFDLVALVLFLVLYRDPDFIYDGEQVEAGADTKMRIGDALKNPIVVGIAIIFLFDSGAFMAINGFFTTYLVNEINADIQQAAFIISLAAIIGAVFAPIFGALSDRLGTKKWLLLLGLLAGVVYTVWVFQETDINMFYIIVVVGGICGGGVPSLCWSSAPDAVKPQTAPAAFAMLAFTQNIGMFIGAVAAGNAISAFGWFTTTCFVLAPCYIIAAIILFTVCRKLK